MAPLDAILIGPPRLAYAFQLVTEEIATNIVKYAFEEGVRSEILVEFASENGEVVLRFDDNGRPFDPSASRPSALENPPEERQAGGMGLQLVHQYASSLLCRREGDRNLLGARLRA